MTSLISVHIPSSVTYIGDNFVGFSSTLTEIIVDPLNPNYTSDNNILFDKNYNNLIRYAPAKTETNYIIPTSVTNIGISAFSGCHNLKSVTIQSNNIVKIRTGTFYNCSNLEDITIPSSVNNIGDAVFGLCYKLKTINVDAENQYYESIDGVLIDKINNILVQYPPGKQDMKYLIPENITTIGNNAFCGSNNLRDVIIPSHVIKIEFSAFSDCENLISVNYLGSNNPSYSSKTFYNCKSLELICVPLDYSSDNFCDNIQLCKSDSYDTIRSRINHCYTITPYYEQRQCMRVNRYNATQWMRRSNDCFNYTCDNEKGPIIESICENMCIDDKKCFSKESNTDKTWQVDIEIDNSNRTSITYDDIVSELKNLTGINDIIVTMNYEEEGSIIHIIVYVNDKKTAEKMKGIIVELMEDEYVRIVKVQCSEVPGLSLSNGHNVFSDLFQTLMMITMMFF